MKKAILISCLLTFTAAISLAQAPADCPKGDNTNPGHINQDVLKNRGTTPASYQEMPFDSLYTMQLSSDIRACNRSVSVFGYILEVADGGIESCNCHSKIRRDTYIYLVANETVREKRSAIIVEVTPRFRDQMGSTQDIKSKWLHHYVIVSGYLFQDDEHKDNSTVDNGKGLLWRHTTWEIHPVTKIQLIK